MAEHYRPEVTKKMDTNTCTNCIGSLVVREEGINFEQTTKDL